jgi:hypothetical protein
VTFGQHQIRFLSAAASITMPANTSNQSTACRKAAALIQAASCVRISSAFMDLRDPCAAGHGVASARQVGKFDSEITLCRKLLKTQVKFGGWVLGTIFATGVVTAA